MPVRVAILGEGAAELGRRVSELSDELDVRIVRTEARAADAPQVLDAAHVDVALVRASLDGGSGFDVVARVASAKRPPAVVFLSEREEDAVRAFELDATDFVPWPVQDGRLRDALLRARQHVLRAALLRTADELQRLLGEVASVDALRGQHAEVAVGAGASAGWTGARAQQPWDARFTAALAALRGDAAERTSGAAAFAATMSGAGTSRGERGWRGAVGDSARGRDEEMVLDLSATSERREPVTEQRPLRVMVREGRRTRFVPLTDIDWFEADGNYIVVHAGNDRFRTRGTITAIEQALDPRQFVRIHRRMVVNMDRVREMSPLPGGDGLLLLSNGQHLRLSRTFRNRVR